MRREMKIPFAILCAVPFIMVLGNSMLIPLLPVIRGALNLTLSQVGLLITAFSLPAALIIPLAGYLSDRLSRKVVMVPALCIYGLGGLIAGVAALILARPYPVILAGRVVQGIGAGGTYQLAMALTGDVFQSAERSWALGLLEASNGLGKVVSPIAGAAFGLISWIAPFFAYGILALPIAGLVALVVKEPAKPKADNLTGEEYLRTLKHIFRAKGASLGTTFLAGSLVLFNLFGVLSLLSDGIEASHGIRGLWAGLLIALPVGAMALTSYFSGAYLQGQEPRTIKLVTLAGLTLVALGLVLFGLVTNIYSSFLAVIIQGIGTGGVLTAVNTLITGAASKEERGIITCLYGSMRFGGVALGPPVFGLMPAIGRSTLFFAAATLTAAILVGTLAFLKADSLLVPQPSPS